MSEAYLCVVFYIFLGSESAIAQFVTKRKQFLADLETGWTNAVNSRLKDTISLESQMEKLFHDAATMFSDVIFVVRSKPIHAHRIILRLRRGHWDIIKDLEIGKIAADFDQKTNTWTFNSRSGISAAEIENALLFLYTGSNAYLPGYRAFCQKNNLSWNDTNDQLFVEQIGSNFEEVFNDGFDEEYVLSCICQYIEAHAMTPYLLATGILSPTLHSLSEAMIAAYTYISVFWLLVVNFLMECSAEGLLRADRKRLRSTKMFNSKLSMLCYTLRTPISSMCTPRT
jgi:hypothetical protein